MKRRPLSLFCLAVILFLLLGTKLTGTFPSEYEALEGESVTLVGSGRTVQQMIGNVFERKRYSSLAKRIREMKEESY